MAGTSGSTVSMPGPDGSTYLKWLPDHSAAYRRVLYQDTAFANSWLQQQIISQNVWNQVLFQLSMVCAGNEPPNHALLFEEGCQLLGNYSRLSYEEQIRWVSMDRDLRTHIFNGDLRTRDQWTGTLLSEQFMAVQTRMEINLQQMAHLDRILASHASKSIANTPDGSRPNGALSHTVSTAVRAPLAPVSGNVSVKREATQPGSLKRKRNESLPQTKQSFTTLCETSDNEDALQDQADAIQAKIAAIRARTAHEDQLIPSKRSKLSSKALPTKGLKQSNSVSVNKSGSGKLESNPVHPAFPAKQHVQDTVAPFANPPDPTGAFRLPRSSQQEREQPHAAVSGWELLSHPAVKAAGFGVKELPTLLRVIKKLGLKHPEASDGARTVLAVGAMQKALERAKAAPPNPVMVQASTAIDHQTVSRPVAAQRARPEPANRVVGDHRASLPPQRATPQQSIISDPTRAGPSLCEEQQHVVDLIMQGNNVFYTGSAGCGKSTVLKSFVSQLRDNGKTVKIVAPTGKAALDINGSTTWTFAGWTPGHMKKPLSDLVKAGHGKFVQKRLKSTDVLVIDEVSMVENHILVRLNALMKVARNNDKAFGGVQLIVTGDFCQLPPVKPFAFCLTCGREQAQRIGPNGQRVYRCPQHGDCSDHDKWAFMSSAWEECKFKHVNLTNIHRQSDEVFIKILQKLRIGHALTNADRKLLLDHPCDVTNAVKLFPTREEVRRINQTEFDRLRTAKRNYTSLDYFKWNEEHGNLREKGRRNPRDDSLEALREHRLETMVEFKAGMLVVLLVNLDIDKGLVNGSQGRIIGFEPFAEYKLPKASISRDDGFSRSFGSSQRGSKSKSRRYRESSAEPPIVQGELRGEYAVLRQDQIRDFILQGRNENKMWPIVEFDNGIRRTIYADCQVNELGDEKPYTLLARTQIPLIAAWAMTVHKSQGMTLNKVIVDLSKSFEEGQEYVALSRARSLEGLKVMSLGENVGQGGNEQVKKFLKDKFGLC